MNNLSEVEHNFYYDKVRNHSPEKLNVKIDKKTNRILAGLKSMGPYAMKERLIELDQEWDIDRVLMANFSLIVFTQLAFALKTRNKKWLFGPIIQTPFLLMHAALGWCPPTPLFRALGVRTRHEIQAEREVILRMLSQGPESIH